LYIYFGKINQERDKLNFLINSILSNFFLNEEENAKMSGIKLENVNEEFTLNTDDLIMDVINETRSLERLLYPEKEFFLSEKMNFLMSKNVKNMSIKICDFISKKVMNNEYLAIKNLKIKSENIVKSIEIDSTNQIIIEEQFDNKNEIEETKKNSQDLKIIEETQTSPNEMANTKTANDEKEDLLNVSIMIENKEIPQESKNMTPNNTENPKKKLNNLKSRTFFGYYNFYHFFNYFVILYERLKFMKSLTDKNNGYQFMKKLFFLKLTNTIDSDLFEDICSCLLSEFNGVFLNLDKILSNIIKEIPLHEIDQFVLESNTHLFYKDLKKNNPNILNKDKHLLYKKTSTLLKDQNQEMLLFLKTCHKLNSLTIKSKSNCKQSQIQSYINNNNLVNDHILKFEFRPRENMFVIHKIKSIFKQSQKQVRFGS